MTDPVMSYLTVEPFEVRHEVLVKAQLANDWLDAGLTANDAIPLDDQQAWKDGTTQKLLDSIRVQIDGRAVEPIITQAWANTTMTIGPGGEFEDGAWGSFFGSNNADGDGGSELHRFTVTQVPEPGTVLLLVSGFAGLVTWRRRRAA